MLLSMFGMMEGTPVKQAATFMVPTGFIASVWRQLAEDLEGPWC